MTALRLINTLGLWLNHSLSLTAQKTLFGTVIFRVETLQMKNGRNVVNEEKTYQWTNQVQDSVKVDVGSQEAESHGCSHEGEVEVSSVSWGDFREEVQQQSGPAHLNKARIDGTQPVQVTHLHKHARNIL